MSAAPSDSNCYHCGLPVPPGAEYQVVIFGEPRAMCCPGCQTVAQAIVDNNLTSYYQQRTSAPRTPQELVPDALRQLKLYDREEVQRSFVQVQEGDIREASLILEGIVCAACIWLSEQHVQSLPGVLDFRINYSTHRARLRWDVSRIQLSEVLEAIAAIGYVAHPFDPGRQEELYKKERSKALRRLVVAGLGMMQAMTLATSMYLGVGEDMDPTMRSFMRWISLIITVPVVLYSAQTFFISAWRDLKRRKLGMDVPVSIAIGGAFLASVWATVMDTGEVYFDSVNMFTFFLLTGRFLEMGARHRAGQAMESLVRLLPKLAIRIDADGQEKEIAVTDVRPGDRLRIRPGDSVPCDGVVLEGRSSLDESLLTGESLPQLRGEGDPLIGGTVNVEGPLVMRVDKVGEDTVLSSIIRLLDRAQTEKPQIAHIADRVAAWFVGVMLLLAISVYAYWSLHAPEHAFWIVLSVLVVTCPCALSLATPTAITVATGRMSRSGLLTTRGPALEALAQATDVVFDKTGTLTHGQLQWVASYSLTERSEAELLRLAAALEQGSEHPIARAVQQAYAEQVSEVLLPRVHKLDASPGFGICGVVEGQALRLGRQEYIGANIKSLPPLKSGETRIWLADEAQVLGAFVFTDTLRKEAKHAIEQLRAAGLTPHLFSGDGPSAVRAIAEQLGIEDAQARMRPDDKLAAVRALEAEGRRVMMIGDGVNDAPVLAGSDVSVAMGKATQIAQASADLVLFSEHLPHLAEGVHLARRTFRIIRQNFAWAIGYNLIAIPFASAGYIAPWMAAIGMSLSSLVVVLNALRLGR
jgi:Cu2+-exporting ATPase